MVIAHAFVFGSVKAGPTHICCRVRKCIGRDIGLFDYRTRVCVGFSESNGRDIGLFWFSHTHTHTQICFRVSESIGRDIGLYLCGTRICFRDNEWIRLVCNRASEIDRIVGGTHIFFRDSCCIERGIGQFVLSHKFICFRVGERIGSVCNRASDIGLFVVHHCFWSKCVR